MINKEVLISEIKKHKIFLSRARDTHDEVLMNVACKIGKDIALALSGFKCQVPDCNQKEKLQYHHLIGSHCMHFMEYWHYLSQRNYFDSTLILCLEHHTIFHCGHNKEKQEIQMNRGDNIFITKERIQKVKNKFFIDTQTPEVKLIQ